jgi:hypothetical protein
MNGATCKSPHFLVVPSRLSFLNKINSLSAIIWEQPDLEPSHHMQ